MRVLKILEWCQAFQMVEALPKIGKFKPNGQAWPPASLPHRSTTQRIHCDERVVGFPTRFGSA